MEEIVIETVVPQIDAVLDEEVKETINAKEGGE